MAFEAAVIKEQGVSFVVLPVKSHVFNLPSSKQEMIIFGQLKFPGLPIVLMRKRIDGRAEYYGRPDILKFLSNVHPSRLPWAKYP